MPNVNAIEVQFHPLLQYNGFFLKQENLINEKPWFRNSKGMALFYYDAFSGGVVSWSLDNRDAYEVEGKLDFYNGGYTRQGVDEDLPPMGRVQFSVHDQNAFYQLTMTHHESERPASPDPGYLQIGRPIVIHLISRTDPEAKYAIRTEEHLARVCGRLLDSCIAGDPKSTEVKIQLPDFKSAKIIGRYLRLGEIHSPKSLICADEFVSLFINADYLQSDYLTQICINLFSDLTFAGDVAKHDDFCPLKFPEHLINLCLKPSLLFQGSPWIQILAQWAKRSKAVSHVYLSTALSMRM